MEVSTRINGQEVKTLLELDHSSRPLELQRCHPVNQSKFILHQTGNGILIRIYDSFICSEVSFERNLGMLNNDGNFVPRSPLCENPLKKRKSSATARALLHVCDGQTFFLHNIFCII